VDAVLSQLAQCRSQQEQGAVARKAVLVLSGGSLAVLLQHVEGETVRLLIIALLAVALFAGYAVAKPLDPAALTNLAPNPSFEEGVVAGPLGWSAATGGTWVERGRAGGRAIGASAAPGATWQSTVMPAADDQSYRMNGWIDCRSGEAVLGFGLLDADGKVLASVKAPALKPTSGWAFTAVEADAPAGCTGVRAWFRTTGEAYLDDVVVMPMVVEQTFNPTFNPNTRGGVTFWDNMVSDGPPGRPNGRLTCDTTGGRNGSSALVVSAPDGWFGARNLESVFPMLEDGLTVFKFTGYSKATSGQAPVFVGWMDAKAQMIREDPIGSGPTTDGWTLREGVVQRPKEAIAIKLLALAQGGEVRYDDFSLRAVQPVRNIERMARVHINQVGYEAAGAKSLVVATNFYPTDSNQGTLELISDSGNRVYSAPVVCGGRIHDGEPHDWGYYFWRADFSSFRTAGKYRAVVIIGGTRGESYPFEIGDGLLMNRLAGLGVDFFFIQRCGFDVPGWHKECHMDDANLPDGKHIDVTGGWHSAGDYNKLMYENGDGGCSYALLTAYKVAPAAFDRYDRDKDGVPDAVDEAEWGCKYVAKMQIPESGGVYPGVGQGPGRTWMKWSPPDVHTDNIVGTADDPVIDPDKKEGNSPLVIGVWARMSAMLDKRGIKNDYMDHAVRYWDYISKDVRYAGSPHVLVSALDMYQVTGERRYLDYARGSVEEILGSQLVVGRLRGAFGSFGEWNAAALASFALAYPDDPLVRRIKLALERWVSFAETTADNPFGLSKQSVSLEAANNYFFVPSAIFGFNFQQLGRAWAGALTYRLIGDQRALSFAADQLDWVMGKNPYGICMVEGAGSHNPNAYHHRYNSIPGHERGAVPGAVPNGMVRNVIGLDVPGFDLSQPDLGDEGLMRRERPSYRTNEPWLVHNMHLLLALSGLSPAAQPAPAR